MSPQPEQLTQLPPPHSDTAERAVLAAMLMDARATDTARETLTHEDFYEIAHALVYRAILALADAGVQTDLVVLVEAMSSSGTLAEAGGPLWLAQLTSEVASPAQVAEHAAIVAEYARLRRLDGLAMAMHSRVATGAVGTNSRELAEGQVGALSDMLVGSARGGLAPAAEVASEALERLQEARSRGTGITGVPTSLRTLTGALGGLQPGALCILGARPSVGKTALAMAWSMTAAEAGAPAAVFSLEMHRVEVMQRLVSLDCGADLLAMRTGQVGNAEMERIAASHARIAALPIHIDDRPGATVSQIRTQCRRMRATVGLGLVIVDYLQLVTPEGRYGSREQDVAGMSRSFKMLGGELEVPVVVLSQLNRAGETRTEKRPRLSDLRETGSLEQDADVVVFLHRPLDYGQQMIEIGSTSVSTANLVECILAKQRNGPTLSFWLDWHPQNASFTEHITPLQESAGTDYYAGGDADPDFA